MTGIDARGISSLLNHPIGTRIMIRTSLLAATLLAVASPTHAQEKPQPAEQHAPAGESRIEIRSSPLLSLHMLARAGVAGAEVPECVRAAVEEMRATGNAMPWGATDGLFATANDVAAVRDALVAMSARLPGSAGEHVVAYVDALEEAQPVFIADVWPDHETRIKDAQVALDAALDAHGPACMAQLCRLLGIADPGAVIPAYLVADAPSPGGFTALTRAHGPVCIVSIDSHRGSTLVEATLHEAIHALDARTREQQPPTVLQALRTALTQAGISSTDTRMRDLPHTLVFAAAAETTRREVDPNHVDYAETGGYYAKLPEARTIVLPAWQKYIAGEIDAAELVSAIAEHASGSD